MAQFQEDEFKFPDEIEDKKEGGEVEDQLEIEIEDDTPEEDRGREPLPKPLVEELEKDELDDYDEKVKIKLKQMRKVWHDERREKEAARREQLEAVALAQKLYEENQRIRKSYQSDAQQFAQSAKQAAEMELAAAKQALKAAHEEFDAEKIVEAQQALNLAQLKALRAGQFRPEALQEKETEVQPQQEPQLQAARPDEKALAWQKRNPWFGPNRSMTAYALGLHEELVGNGVPVGSDEYYSALDRTLRKRFPDEFGETEKQTKSKASTVVAPATRSTSPNKIRLKATQVQLAKKLGLTPEQYAREMMKLESQNG